MENDISIIHEPSVEEPFAVIIKPAGLPCAPLQEYDDCAYSRAEKIFPSLINVNGRKQIEHGLVHRLDTVTEGIVLIAADQKFYDSITADQEAGKFVKHYSALCDSTEKILEGFCECPNYFSAENRFSAFKLSSFFRPYGDGKREVRPVTESCSRIIRKKAGNVLYETSVNSVKKSGDFYKVSCSLQKGFRHQVRCHLAWCGLPICNDKVYSPFESCGEDFRFASTKIEFMYENRSHVFEYYPGF